MQPIRISRGGAENAEEKHPKICLLSAPPREPITEYTDIPGFCKSARRPQASERKQRGRTDRSAMFPVARGTVEMPAGYADWLTGIKTRIHSERLRVVLASNAAMVLLYWDIGQSIIGKQTAQGYGTRVIDRLAADLGAAFPEMKGFSPRNLKYMRAFAAAWPDREVVQRIVAQLT